MSSFGRSLPISALQHWLFCQRQCALIHVERLWEENRLTVEGRILHKRADAGRAESRKGVRILRSVQIASSKLLLHGVADVVEMHQTEPYPVEYKRGRPKEHDADKVQLCAQALCLEEMTGESIKEGALFYGTAQRRMVVSFDRRLRALTEQVAEELHCFLSTAELPLSAYSPEKCDACSLIELCSPKTKQRDVAGWMIQRTEFSGVPE
ncbi:MAG: CRISPR-associated protein Cas4 [Rhodobacteraceae bacterium]|nr:CRISPR-associated protein Cas4 [Paracoccaceae bacterium]